jgi:hypothetical protein
MAGEDPNASEAERQKREAEAKAAADAKATEEKATADVRAAEEKAAADARAAETKAAADARAAEAKAAADARAAEAKAAAETSTPPASDGTPPRRQPIQATLNLTRQHLQQIETASLLILFVAAIGILLIIIFYPMFGAPSFETKSAVELLLALAGTVIILALLSRSASAIILVIGFLIIGALVVPTNDLIRFALIATGSEESYRDIVFAPARFSGRKSQLDRSEDMARKIYQDLRQDGIVCDLPHTPPNAVISEIQEILRREEELQAFENVLQRGSLELLLALADSEDDANDRIVYLYGQDERFIDNIEFLRQEGMVSFIYDDYNTIEILPSGKALADRVLLSREPTQPEAPTRAARPIPASSQITSLSVDTPAAYPVSGAESWFTFDITREGIYEISATQDMADPVLTLLEADGQEIASNDDSAGGLNSLISLTLVRGTYYVILEDLRSSMEPITVQVSLRGSFEDTGEATWTCAPQSAEVADASLSGREPPAAVGTPPIAPPQLPADEAPAPLSLSATTPESPPDGEPATPSEGPGAETESDDRAPVADTGDPSPEAATEPSEAPVSPTPAPESTPVGPAPDAAPQ